MIDNSAKCLSSEKLSAILSKYPWLNSIPRWVEKFVSCNLIEYLKNSSSTQIDEAEEKKIVERKIIALENIVEAQIEYEQEENS